MICLPDFPVVAPWHKMERLSLRQPLAEALAGTGSRRSPESQNRTPPFFPPPFGGGNFSAAPSTPQPPCQGAGGLGESHAVDRLQTGCVRVHRDGECGVDGRMEESVHSTTSGSDVEITKSFRYARKSHAGPSLKNRAVCPLRGRDLFRLRTASLTHGRGRKVTR